MMQTLNPPLTAADPVVKVRQQSQLFSYTSMLLHEAIGKHLGFMGTDYKHLPHFIKNGPMTAGEVAQLTGLTTGAVTGLIDRLAERKLVRRVADAQDRRKIIIVPNVEKMRALLNPHYSDFQEKTETLLSEYTEEELNVLTRFFEDLTQIMNEKIYSLQQKNRFKNGSAKIIK